MRRPASSASSWGRHSPPRTSCTSASGKIAALAIFSSDALSSVAYASEEMLKTLFIAGFGAVAFSLVMPLTLAITCVLAILIFSYRQTIKAYPSAGGAYIVTKDNFGLLPAQVAGVALLTDYVLTVAVSVSAGVAAIIAAAPSLHVFRVPMAVVFICLIALGNLRGVRESGKIFAAPTYLFILSVVSLIVIGLVRLATGSLEPGGAVATGEAEPGVARRGPPLHRAPCPRLRQRRDDRRRGDLERRAGVQGSRMAERPEDPDGDGPDPRRRCSSGSRSWRRACTPRPTSPASRPCSPTSARTSSGRRASDTLAFLVLQVATTLILVLAANTAFADFPRLANFHADDNFLPRQFTTRGHRLVFSNGIIALAAAAAVLVVIFRADVTRLIPFYAIGVFTSFSLSQAGMAKRHLRLREPGWKLGLVINGAGAVATAVVLVVISITKFAEGAWAVMVLVPVLVWLLMRMNHQYERERGELEEDLQSYVTIPRDRPMALLLVRDVDDRTIHALQYAKTLRAETLAVHLEDDPMHTLLLEAAWHQAGLQDDVPLRIARGSGDEAERLAGFVGALPTERDITVLVPVAHDVSALERLSESRDGYEAHPRAPPLRARPRDPRPRPSTRPSRRCSPPVPRRTGEPGGQAHPAWDAHERGPGRQARPSGSARGGLRAHARRHRGASGPRRGRSRSRDAPRRRVDVQRRARRARRGRVLGPQRPADARGRGRSSSATAGPRSPW